MIYEDISEGAAAKTFKLSEVLRLENQSPTSSKHRASGRGLFIFGRESLVMRKWQILEFDGIPYYAFVPEEVVPIKEETIPELHEDASFVAEEPLTDDGEHPNDINSSNERIVHQKLPCPTIDQEDPSDDDSTNNQSMIEEYNEPIEDGSSSFDQLDYFDRNDQIETSTIETRQCKANHVNTDDSYGDFYQVKVEAGVVTLEKLHLETLDSGQQVYTDENAQAAEPIDRKMDRSLGEEQSQDLDGFDEQRESGDDEAIVDELVAAEQQDRVASPGANVSLKCKVCSETFDSTLAFRKHVAWTHKKKVCIQQNGAYVCSVCDYSTHKKSLFAAHLQRKHDTWSRGKRHGTASTFPCSACGFVCRSKHSLQSHFIRKHTDRYEHQCNFCSKKFKVKGDLTNHVRFHHKEKPVHCDVCGKLCLNSGSLYVHQKWAHYKPKYECNICKRRMVTQENLNQHMLMQHERREKIVCPECDKTFTKKDSFKRHMAVHTGNKPYSCVICSKPFARRSQLRQHLLIHTGKRPFVCDICGKAFTQKPGLICHRKTHPGTHPPLPVMPIGDIVKEFTDSYEKGKIITPDKEYENEDPEERDGEEDNEIEEQYEEEVLEETIEEEKVE